MKSVDNPNDLQAYRDLAKQLIGRELKNPQLLQTAFTHCSYLNEHRKTVMENNERLEFLGDAVLEIAVTRHLYLNYNHAEGILTTWRAALVRTESLAAAANNLGFAKYLRLSKGEQRNAPRALEQILANTFEAVLGAIYLDCGYKVVSDFIERHIIVTLQDILREGTWLDAKTRLQEHIQNIHNQIPVYRILEEEGPDHDKLFHVGVYVNEELLGRGRGHSKQAGQQAAAAAALKAQNITPPTV